MAYPSSRSECSTKRAESCELQKRTSVRVRVRVRVRVEARARVRVTSLRVAEEDEAAEARLAAFVRCTEQLEHR